MTTSLILPYWDRQEAATRALQRMSNLYAGIDLEIIVVDDGNAEPFQVPDFGLNIRVITLPRKDEPKSPCTCWNAGVEAALGDIVMLSCVEILHDKPVLAELAAAVRAGGPDAYALAAAWCPEEARYHTHSTVDVPTCPPGTGIAFLGAMHRDLYLKVGGFDEVYRDGAGYEDRDFIQRLSAAGAKFIMRDDLVVTHPKSGASIAWGDAKFARNEALYRSKWEMSGAVPVTVVCLNAGNYCGRGAEYVNMLFDMVRRNLSIGWPGRFVCVTDDATGLDEGVETMPLPDGMPGWWGKLYLFKRGLFADGERVIFMDLDTLVVGNLDEIFSYDGEFATLRDFYVPQRVGPAIMAWRAGGMASSIWDDWRAEGMPQTGHGDLWWINNLDQGRFAKACDKLQDLFPGAFQSFKANCNPYPPAGTRVVCFHGLPRPHEASERWVRDVWRINGGGMPQIEIVCNTHKDKVAENVRSAVARGLPELDFEPVHDGHAVIVGGGPSLVRTLDEIRWRKSIGQKVYALNGAGKFLLENGITPDFQVIADSRAQNVAFVQPQSASECFISSMCDPSIFDAASGVTVYHVDSAGVHDNVPDGAKLISTGSTVALIAMGIAHIRGYRMIHLFGVDSSYDANHHAYAQSWNDEDTVIEARVGDDTFKCAPWMLAQVNQFQELTNKLIDDGCTITVAGDGLLPTVAKAMMEILQEAA